MSAGPEQQSPSPVAPVAVPQLAADGPGLLDEITKNTRVARDQQQRDVFEQGLCELARPARGRRATPTLRGRPGGPDQRGDRPDRPQSL